MKRLTIAFALGLAAVAAAAPASPPASAPKAAAAPAAKAAPAATLPPECVERLKQHAERMKKELGLTDAQAAAVRNENERFRGALMTARAEHREKLAAILSPEQMAKLEGKGREMREKRMARCAMDDDEGDDDHEGKDKGKGKEKR